MLQEKTATYFKHFGEELAVTIGEADPANVTGLFTEATKASSFTDNRAEIINTLPTALFAMADVTGVGVNDVVVRGSKTYYVVDFDHDGTMITLYLSEDAP